MNVDKLDDCMRSDPDRQIRQVQMQQLVQIILYRRALTWTFWEAFCALNTDNSDIGTADSSRWRSWWAAAMLLPRTSDMIMLAPWHIRPGAVLEDEHTDQMYSDLDRIQAD